MPASVDLTRAAVPTVSVIIPAYNCADVLPHAVAAVAAQTFADWEVIVVDDASHDDVAGALSRWSQDPRFRLIRHAENAGPTAARNTGIDAARGRFVAFLDADDSWMATKLERQVAAVMMRPDPDRVFCVTSTVVRLTEGRHLIRPRRAKRPDERMDEFIYVEAGFCQTSSFFVSRAIATRIGFRELPTGEDHLFAIDACNAGAEYLLIEEPLTVYNDDMRTGRLSNRRSLERGRAFMAAVRDLISPKALMAYEAGYLGMLLLRRDPIRGLATVFSAVAAGALPPRFAASLIARAATPTALYGAIRARLLGRRTRSSQAGD